MKNASTAAATEKLFWTIFLLFLSCFNSFLVFLDFQKRILAESIIPDSYVYEICERRINFKSSTRLFFNPQNRHLQKQLVAFVNISASIIEW